MKQALLKFSVVPSYRSLVTGVVAGGAAIVGSSAFAAVSEGAVAAISEAGSEGQAVGTAVVAVVAALCVVGIVIALVRKV